MATAANVAVANLQATLNRFVKVASFSPLVIDGGMGAKTEEATVKTLQFIEGGCKGGCVGPQTMQAASTAIVGADSQQGIMQNIAGIQRLCEGVAELLSLPAAALVSMTVTSGGNGGVPMPVPARDIKVVPPPSMGFVDKSRLWFRQQPTTTQAGIGIAGGLLALFAFHGWRKSKKGA